MFSNYKSVGSIYTFVSTHSSSEAKPSSKESDLYTVSIGALM